MKEIEPLPEDAQPICPTCGVTTSPACDADVCMGCGCRIDRLGIAEGVPDAEDDDQRMTHAVSLVYDGEADAAYIEFAPLLPGSVDHSVECLSRDGVPAVVIDVTKTGTLAGIELIGASDLLPEALLRGAPGRAEPRIA